MSTPDPRWYNHLAAWVYGWLCEPIMDLAVPVWTAEAEADMEAQWEAECRLAAFDVPTRPETDEDGYLPF